MHLFFAITKIGIGNAFGEPFWIVLKLVFCILQPEKTILPRVQRVSALATMALEKPMRAQWATEFRNGTMLEGLPFAVNRASTISCLWAEVLPS